MDIAATAGHTTRTKSTEEKEVKDSPTTEGGEMIVLMTGNLFPRDSVKLWM